MRNFNPHVVICSLPATADLEHVQGWIELLLDVSQPMMVSIKGHYLEQSNHMRLEQLTRID